MIERVQSRSGKAVIKINGRHLASVVEPVLEARAWLSRRREFLDRVKTVFVLGAGSGYHIHELSLNTAARILVIERNSELCEAVKSIHRFDRSRIRFLELDRPRELRACEDVRVGLCGSFVVLQHAPSQAMDPDFYRDCLALLVARDWGNLNWQWQLNGFAPLESETRIQSQRDPLSLLDLEQTELVQNSEERERMLIKALRELLK